MALLAERLYPVLEKRREQSEDSAFCSLHDSNPILFWCTECRVKLCITGFQLQHQKHKLVSHKTYLHTEISSVLETESLQSPGILQLANSTLKICEDEIENLELMLKQYKHKVEEMQKQMREYENFVSIDCPEMQQLADDAENELDVSSAENFLDRQELGNDLERMTHQTVEAIERNTKIELKTECYAIVAGSQQFGWFGSLEYAHGDIRFAIGIVNLNSREANSRYDTLIEVLLNLKNEGSLSGPQANITVSGEIIVESPLKDYSRGSSEHISFELQTETTRNTSKRITLPISNDCREISSYVAKTVLPKHWIKQPVMSSFTLRCIFSVTGTELNG